MRAISSTRSSSSRSRSRDATRLRCRVFLDQQVTTALGRDLRQVGHAQHLRVRGHVGQ
jgi:hypothetical protein